jgi:hypothetical protein
MATTLHALDSGVGYRETAEEGCFVAAIASCWRTVLFSAETTGKSAQAWLVWTAAGRGRFDRYQTIPISRVEARAALVESDAGDLDSDPHTRRSSRSSARSRSSQIAESTNDAAERVAIFGGVKFSRDDLRTPGRRSDVQTRKNEPTFEHAT